MDSLSPNDHIPGCFNVGESDYQYHGANRLGANSLLSCIFGGLTAGKEIPRYLESLEISSSRRSLREDAFNKALNEEEEIRKDLMSRNGPENVFALHDELAEWLVANDCKT